MLHPDLKSTRRRRAADLALAEAVSLADALPDLLVTGAEVVRLARPHPGMLFGAGKIAELKTRYSLILVTHNVQQAARVADYTAFLYGGQLLEHAESMRLFTTPQRQETEDYITGRYG